MLSTTTSTSTSPPLLLFEGGLAATIDAVLSLLAVAVVDCLALAAAIHPIPLLDDDETRRTCVRMATPVRISCYEL